jgi:hypothetical protein
MDRGLGNGRVAAVVVKALSSVCWTRRAPSNAALDDTLKESAELSNNKSYFN